MASILRWVTVSFVGPPILKERRGEWNMQNYSGWTTFFKVHFSSKLIRHHYRHRIYSVLRQLFIQGSLHGIMIIIITPAVRESGWNVHILASESCGVDYVVNKDGGSLRQRGNLVIWWSLFSKTACLPLKSPSIHVGMLVLCNLCISVYGKKGRLGGRYVVDIIIGPKLVSISTAKKSVSKSPYSLCLMLYFIAMADPSDSSSV